jgi:hypothetical protein
MMAKRIVPAVKGRGGCGGEEMPLEVENTLLVLVSLAAVLQHSSFKVIF